MKYDIDLITLKAPNMAEFTPTEENLVSKRKGFNQWMEYTFKPSKAMLKAGFTYRMADFYPYGPSLFNDDGTALFVIRMSRPFPTFTVVW